MNLLLYSSNQKVRISLETLLLDEDLIFHSIGSFDDLCKWVVKNNVDHLLIHLSSDESPETFSSCYDHLRSDSIHFFASTDSDPKGISELQNRIIPAIKNSKKEEEHQLVVAESDKKDFLIKINTTYKKISKKDILYIVADGKYCVIHIDGRTYSIRESLKAIALYLSSSFTRVHASYILNIDKIQSIDTFTNSIQLVNNDSIVYSRKYKNHLLSIFSVK